jgi:hypothetical protein
MSVPMLGSEAWLKFVDCLKGMDDAQRAALVGDLHDRFCWRCGRWYETPGILQSCRCVVVMHSPFAKDEASR